MWRLTRHSVNARRMRECCPSREGRNQWGCDVLVVRISLQVRCCSPFITSEARVSSICGGLVAYTKSVPYLRVGSVCCRRTRYLHVNNCTLAVEPFFWSIGALAGIGLERCWEKSTCNMDCIANVGEGGEWLGERIPEELYVFE